MATHSIEIFASVQFFSFFLNKGMLDVLLRLKPYIIIVHIIKLQGPPHLRSRSLEFNNDDLWSWRMRSEGLDKIRHT
jgi:hypothetical protein